MSKPFKRVERDYGNSCPFCRDNYPRYSDGKTAFHSVPAPVDEAPCFAEIPQRPSFFARHWLASFYIFTICVFIAARAAERLF